MSEGRRRISSGGPWEERVGYSRAVVVGRVLDEAGGGVRDIVAVRIYLTRIEEWEAVTSTIRAVLGETRPAMTLVQVAGLLLPAHRVEIEVEAFTGSGREMS
jgi:enamine deaminase RidA (YjgF/YER057c/UK114 family)